MAGDQREFGGKVAGHELRKIDGVFLEVGERAMFQSALLRGAQHHAWRRTSIQRFLPARRAQAPAIARLQTIEAVLRVRGGQVVAGGFAECKEFDGHHDADRMAAEIFGAGVATAVAEKAGHRFGRADVERTAEYVAGRPAARATGCFVERHRFAPWLRRLVVAGAILRGKASACDSGLQRRTYREPK